MLDIYPRSIEWLIGIVLAVYRKMHKSVDNRFDKTRGDDDVP